MCTGGSRTGCKSLKSFSAQRLERALGPAVGLSERRIQKRLKASIPAGAKTRNATPLRLGLRDAAGYLVTFHFSVSLHRARNPSRGRPPPRVSKLPRPTIPWTMHPQRMAQIRRGYDIGVAAGIRAEIFALPRANNPRRGCLITVTEAWQFGVEISDGLDVVLIQIGLSD
jgi:hypothetical protein